MIKRQNNYRNPLFDNTVRTRVGCGIEQTLRLKSWTFFFELVMSFLLASFFTQGCRGGHCLFLFLSQGLTL